MIAKPFIPAWTELRAFAPELWLIGTIIAVLLVPFFTRRSNASCALVALIGLAAALLSTIIVGTSGDVVGNHFRGMLVADHVAVLWKALLLIFVIGIVLMWFSTTAGTMHEGDGPEFFTLLLGATLGMSLMGGTSNLLMLIMSIEMASLPSYVLAGFRKTNRIGAEASLKYVLFGAATSAMMAYGLSILYGLCGTLQISEIATQLVAGSSSSPALLAVALAGIIIGVGFKISAVPFHFWCPDVFEGASIDVSAFLSVASKGAALILMLRVVMGISAGLDYANAPQMSLTSLAIVLGIIGSITATVGNTAAFVQTNIKRLLAYSSIAHAGYMLCALTLLVKHNARGSLPDDAAQAILLYLSVYMFMNLGAFTVAGLIWRETGSEELSAYENLGGRHPILALCMAAFMFSLVGLPPFAGFVAKLQVMLALGNNGGWWWALVAVIGLNTVFSLYYYARIIKVMYLQQNEKPMLSPNPFGVAISVVCAVMLVLMLVGYGPLGRLTSTYGKVHLEQAKAPTTAPTTMTALLTSEPTKLER